jgi:hypothetical protein
MKKFRLITVLALILSAGLVDAAHITCRDCHKEELFLPAGYVLIEEPAVVYRVRTPSGRLLSFRTLSMREAVEEALYIEKWVSYGEKFKAKQDN